MGDMGKKSTFLDRAVCERWRGCGWRRLLESVEVGFGEVDKLAKAGSPAAAERFLSEWPSKPRRPVNAQGKD